MRHIFFMCPYIRDLEFRLYDSRLFLQAEILTVG
jgi:hypothetical protein